MSSQSRLDLVHLARRFFTGEDRGNGPVRLGQVRMHKVRILILVGPIRQEQIHTPRLHDLSITGSLAHKRG